MVSNCYIHLKEPEFFSKMADDRSGAENVQDKSGISCHCKKQGRSYKTSRVVLKGVRSYRHPLAQRWNNLNIKKVTTIID